MSVKRDKVIDVIRFTLELYDSVKDLDDSVKTAILSKLKDPLGEVILREFIYSLRESRIESREELEKLIKEFLGVKEGRDLYDIIKRVISSSSSSHNE